MAWLLTALKSLFKCHLYTEAFLQWLCSLAAFPNSPYFSLSIFLRAFTSSHLSHCMFSWLIAWLLDLASLPQAECKLYKDKNFCCLVHLYSPRHIESVSTHLCWTSILPSLPPAIEGPFHCYNPYYYLLRSKGVVMERTGSNYQDPVGRRMGINPMWRFLANLLSLGRSTFCHQDLNLVSAALTYVLLCP